MKGKEKKEKENKRMESKAKLRKGNDSKTVILEWVNTFNTSCAIINF